MPCVTQMHNCKVNKSNINSSFFIHMFVFKIYLIGLNKTPVELDGLIDITLHPNGEVQLSQYSLDYEYCI